MSNNTIKTPLLFEKKLSGYREDDRFIELKLYLELLKDSTQNKLLSTLDSNEVFKLLGELRAYVKLLDIYKIKHVPQDWTSA